MKTFYFLCAIALSTLSMISCTNDDSMSVNESTEAATRSIDNGLVNYLNVVNGQWVLDISEPDAAAMGKSEEYIKLTNQMKQINSRIKELQDNPKATIGFNLPTNERILMRSGKVLSITKVSPFAQTRATGDFITSMTANQSTSFNTSSDEYKVTSHAYVQSLFLWSFELRDDTWNNYWNESGVASSNLDHEWIYSLTNPGIDNYWRFSSTGTQTDGTNITFSFYK